jgi:hypothetical protein
MGKLSVNSTYQTAGTNCTISDGTPAVPPFAPTRRIRALKDATLSYPDYAGLVAWIVHDFVGLSVLRRSWINLDLIWCFGLLGAAAVLLFAPIAT